MSINYEEKYYALKNKFNKVKNRAIELEILVENLQNTNSAKDTNFDTERLLLRKDAEIDRLTCSLDDYKERYKEVREECKDLRKELYTSSWKNK
jgi:chromosome segregation ATPase